MEPSAASSLIVFDSDSPLLYSNEDARVLGYSNALLELFKYVDTRISDYDRNVIEACLQNFQQEFKQKKHFSKNIQFTLEDGLTRWMKVNGYPPIDEIEYFTLSFSDITNEKLHLELLKEGQNLAGIGTWNISLSNNSVQYCDVVQNLLDFPIDRNLKLETALTAFKQGYHRSNISRKFLQAKEANEKFDFETIIVSPNGNEKWLRIVGTPKKYKDKVVAISGLVIDIDKQKKQRKDLDLINRRMKIALDNTNIGIWDLNLVKNEMYWDANMFKLRFPIEQNLDPKYAFKNILKEDHKLIYNSIKKCIKENAPYLVEFRMLSKNDSIRYIRSIGKLIRRSDGSPHRITGVNIDVTEKKQKETELTRLLEVTEKQNDRLINFAYIISHNIRSHTGNIAMLADMLDSEISSEERIEFTEMIKVSTANLNETITQLNEIVTIQSTVATDFVLINIKKTLLKVLESINALVLQSNADIHIKIDDDISILGIEPYLNSVLFNLLTNAIKYKSPKRKLIININTKLVDDEVQLEFRDNGIGIDLEKNGKKIFGMYKTFHHNEDARGIGLFITKNHIEAMNGEINVSSKLDEGTTFQIKLKSHTET